MKITKYPQSCLVIEKAGQRIAIDPGSLFTAKYKVKDLGFVEAVLFTHQHADHFDPGILAELLENDIELYANADVAAKAERGVTVLKDNEQIVVAGFEVTAHDLPHCKMADGSDGPPNTGFVIDGHLFHPGDGIQLPGMKIDNLALPIAGPSINFEEAMAFADQLEATMIIPIHYDVFKADPHEFAQFAGKRRVVVLKDGESTEI